MKQPDTISEFKGKYFFLSNFYNIPVIYGGTKYRNAEAAFQAQKCPDISFQFKRLQPSEAKRLGRAVRLREDWDEVKDQIMFDICLAKFTQNARIRQELLATGDAILIEGNTWGDTYWGQVCGQGENHLGTILMKVRDALRCKERK